MNHHDPKVALRFGMSYYGNVPLKAHIGMLLSSCLCMLPDLIYNACQLELASVSMPENVDKHRRLEVSLRFLASNSSLPAGRVNLTNRHENSQDDCSIPIDTSSRTLSN